MAGHVHFDLGLDPPDNGGPALDGAAVPPPPAQHLQEDVGGAPAPPPLPYAPGPGTYTQLWMSQSLTTSGQEMAEDVESYLSVFLVYAPV